MTYSDKSDNESVWPYNKNYKTLVRQIKDLNK